MLKSLNQGSKIILGCIIFLYLLFLTLDYSFQNTGNKYSIAAKYLSILLCFILTIMIGVKGHNKLDTRLLQLALFFTASADYCLLFSNKFIPGVLLFCIVQIIYIFRFTRDLLSRTRIFISILIMYIFLSFIVIVVYKAYGFDLKLSLICLFYGCLITTSIITGIRTLKTNYFPLTASIMICVGMILFFMCDVNVLLFNILEKNGSYIASICGFLMWLFYLPGQVMLALSGYKHINKKVISGL
jgi:hypothetical protein